MAHSAVTLAWGAASDVGKVRAHNEDAVLATPPIFVVADGMGGHAAGEVASALVIETFEGLAGRTSPPIDQLTTDDIVAALTQANTAILSLASRDRSKAGMGTTAVGLCIVQHEGATYFLAFNLGDSRLYGFETGVLTQITVDHSLVQELVDVGRISPEQARYHPERNVVTRVLGSGFPSSADIWIFPPQPGQRFLLCSDGLSGEVLDDEIASVLAQPDPPDVIADRLLEAALQAGGRDNITVVVVDVLAVTPDESASEQTGEIEVAHDADTGDVEVIDADSDAEPRTGPQVADTAPMALPGMTAPD